MLFVNDFQSPDEHSVVFCRFCGFTSSNITECERCGRKFAKNVKVITVKQKTATKTKKTSTPSAIHVVPTPPVAHTVTVSSSQPVNRIVLTPVVSSVAKQTASKSILAPVYSGGRPGFSQPSLTTMTITPGISQPVASRSILPPVNRGIAPSSTQSLARTLTTPPYPGQPNFTSSQSSIYKSNPGSYTSGRPCFSQPSLTAMNVTQGANQPVASRSILAPVNRLTTPSSSQSLAKTLTTTPSGQQNFSSSQSNIYKSNTGPMCNNQTLSASQGIATQFRGSLLPKVMENAKQFDLSMKLKTPERSYAIGQAAESRVGHTKTSRLSLSQKRVASPLQTVTNIPSSVQVKAEPTDMDEPAIKRRKVRNSKYIGLQKD